MKLPLYHHKIKAVIAKLLHQCVIICLIFILISNYTSTAYTEKNNGYIDFSLTNLDLNETNNLNNKQKELSNFGIPSSPTISLELTSDYLVPNNSSETNVVDVDVSEGSNLQEREIKIAAALNNSDFLSLIELAPTDGWELYYPSLRINKISFPKEDTHQVKTITFSKSGEEIALVSQGNHLFFVNTHDQPSFNFEKAKRDSFSLVTYVPSSTNSLLSLDIPPEGFEAKANVLTYIPNTANPSKSYKFHNILGSLYDQSITLESSSASPLYIKYKSNNLQISETEDPLTLVGISYFANNLRSKSVKQYLDNIIDRYPEFKDNPGNINKYLMSFNGLSLFSLQKNTDNVHLHPKSFRNFYFKDLPSELMQENEASNKYIAGAVLFQNPKTKQTYLAISTYKTEKVEDSPIAEKDKSMLKDKTKTERICLLDNKRKVTTSKANFTSIDITPARNIMLESFYSQKIIYLDGIPISAHQSDLNVKKKTI